ncbi:MAG: Gfo/Idh/MocA family oxidoreductase [Bacteroidaceae bacterium]|nr:Gfo/Idh/MocA family oxidoreductase [Bacteroidaceae bacterium]
MRKLRLTAFLLGMILWGMASQGKAQTKWHWEEGTIVVDSPARPAGQEHALGLTVRPLPRVRVAFVGLGMRGPAAVKRWTFIEGVRIVALCDAEKERAEKCQKTLTDAHLPEADIYSGEKGYEELCAREDIDLVYVTTDWLHHVPVAKCALLHGKHVAIEVPAAMNLQDCWDLINLAEQKRLHCMMLENCCYDWFEMNTLNMAQHDIFGEILHVQGAYIHNLDEFWPEFWHNWRMEYNRHHRGDIYPTHGLGPVTQLLNIHRGDRMKTLVAMDTKAVAGPEYIKKTTGETVTDFRNGDHTTTLIRTEREKVIEIQHNVMSPQPYNRMYQLTGTRGFANKYPVQGYALGSDQMNAAGVKPNQDNVNTHKFLSDEDRAALEKKYRAPILDIYGKKAKQVGGHGGMDFIMDSRLVYCLQNGLPLDMDVYDLAEWCCLAELGALSCDHNNASVSIPDFTRGHCYDIQGFRHAFASPEQEQQSEAIAKAYTQTLKEKGVKEAEKQLEKTLKALAKKSK